MERIYRAEKNGTVIGLFYRPHESELKYMVKIDNVIVGLFDYLADAYREYNASFRKVVMR